MGEGQRAFEEGANYARRLDAATELLRRLRQPDFSGRYPCSEDDVCIYCASPHLPHYDGCAWVAAAAFLGDDGGKEGGDDK
jgi:hypothetical protein